MICCKRQHCYHKQWHCFCRRQCFAASGSTAVALFLQAAVCFAASGSTCYTSNGIVSAGGSVFAASGSTCYHKQWHCFCRRQCFAASGSTCYHKQWHCFCRRQCVLLQAAALVTTSSGIVSAGGSVFCCKRQHCYHKQWHCFCRRQCFAASGSTVTTSSGIVSAGGSVFCCKWQHLLPQAVALFLQAAVCFAASGQCIFAASDTTVNITTSSGIVGSAFFAAELKGCCCGQQR